MTLPPVPLFHIVHVHDCGSVPNPPGDAEHGSSTMEPRVVSLPILWYQSIAGQHNITNTQAALARGLDVAPSAKITVLQLPLIASRNHASQRGACNPRLDRLLPLARNQRCGQARPSPSSSSLRTFPATSHSTIWRLAPRVEVIEPNAVI